MKNVSVTLLRNSQQDVDFIMGRIGDEDGYKINDADVLTFNYVVENEVRNSDLSQGDGVNEEFNKEG